MKRLIFVILFASCCFLLSARKDSTRLTNFRGFYFSAYYPYKIAGGYIDDSKYPDDYYYKFNSLGYKFQTPGVGIGYIINRREMFLKTDFNYWYGTKALNNDFSFTASDINSADTYESFPSFGNQYPPVGYRYYKIKDHYSGNINFHYFDVSLAITGNITRFLRIYSGWRINYMIKHNYNAKVRREASLYEVKQYISQYNRVDTLIEVSNLEYTGSAAASKSTQRFSSFVFYDLGINANFKIKDKLFFVDILIETPPFMLSPSGPTAVCVTFKMAYVFKYSTYFGKKKDKD